jgi:hypothetical protein
MKICHIFKKPWKKGRALAKYTPHKADKEWVYDSRPTWERPAPKLFLFSVGQVVKQNSASGTSIFGEGSFVFRGIFHCGWI